MSLLSEATEDILQGQVLSVERAQEVFTSVLCPGFEEPELAALLTALADRGESVDEIHGVVLSLRGAMQAFDSMPPGSVDTCGTGGDGKDSFNLSTASAIVAAAAGAKVVKHGNRSVSSKCGSADLLEAAGVRLELTSEQAGQVLEDCGMVFLYAPAFHPAMRYVAPVRQALGRRTIFNFVGPLCHPGGVQRQLLGVSDVTRLANYARLLDALGCQRGLVVHGADGADELTLAGQNKILAIGESSAPRFDAEALGLPLTEDAALMGGDVAQNLHQLHSLLNGEKHAIRDAVLLNTAATLWIAEVSTDPSDALARATEALDSGAARRTLERMVQSSRRVLEIQA